jgi:hypothetical protein
MIETTLILKDNLPDNPYIRLHMILDMLENVDEDYVVDKKWLHRQLEYVLHVFMELAKEEKNEQILN